MATRNLDAKYQHVETKSANAQDKPQLRRRCFPNKKIRARACMRMPPASMKLCLHVHAYAYLSSHAAYVFFERRETTTRQTQLTSFRARETRTGDKQHVQLRKNIWSRTYKCKLVYRKRAMITSGPLFLALGTFSSIIDGENEPSTFRFLCGSCNVSRYARTYLQNAAASPASTRKKTAPLYQPQGHVPSEFCTCPATRVYAACNKAVRTGLLRQDPRKSVYTARGSLALAGMHADKRLAPPRLDTWQP
jgi:hypothetical protein